MDLAKIIQELREEREQITMAIMAMERMAGDRAGARRGRKPKWLAEANSAASGAPVAKRRGRPPGSKNKPKSE